MDSSRRGVRVIALAALGLGAWLLYLSRWVVLNFFGGEHDSHPLVYVLFGSPMWVPGLLLVIGGLRALRPRREQRAGGWDDGLETAKPTD